MKNIALISVLILFLICSSCTRKDKANKKSETQASNLSMNNAKNFTCPQSGFGSGQLSIAHIHSANHSFYTHVCSSDQSLSEFKKDSKGHILKDYSVYIIVHPQGKAFKALEGSSPSSVRLSQKDNMLVITENAYVFGDFQNILKTVFTCNESKCFKSDSRTCILDYQNKNIDPTHVKQLDDAIKKNKVGENDLNMMLDLALLGHDLSQAYIKSEFAYFLSDHLKTIFSRNQYIYSQLKQHDCTK